MCVTSFQNAMSLEAAHNFQLLQSLSSFQRHGLYCDTVIQTKESAVSAHSVILSSFSPLLASLLNQQPMIDNNSNVIDLSVYDTELVQELMDFFYTGKFQSLRLDELQELCAILDVKLVLESIFSPGKDGIKLESNEKVEDASNATPRQSVQKSKNVIKTMQSDNEVGNEMNARQISEGYLEAHSSASLNGHLRGMKMFKWKWIAEHFRNCCTHKETKPSQLLVWNWICCLVTSSVKQKCYRIQRK